MHIIDLLYGEYEISEPIFSDLLHHPALLRLHGVAQHGLPENWFPEMKTFSRFEHSVGVFLLLRKLGAPLKEQVASLLHDVSHTVFSHVIDRVYKTRRSYQDTIHEKYLLISGLAQVLAAHGFDYHDIARYKQFKMLEQPIPQLCADRVDYALRELLHNNKEEVALSCVADLASFSGTIVFKTQEAAKLFAHNYLERSISLWTSTKNAALYAVLAQVLARALQQDILNQKDLFSDDATVLQKLQLSQDPEILRNLERLERGEVHQEDVLRAIPTFRYVDPFFIEGLQLKPLSSVDQEFVAILEDCKRSFSARYQIPLR